MKTKMEPCTGQIFECMKKCRKHGTKKGEFYLYDNGCLKRFTKRAVTMLLNGDEIIEQDGLFERAEYCPFCGLPVYCAEKDEDVFNHDGVRCSRLWDAKVKNYCPDCNSDLKGGKCPNCEP